MGVGPQDIRPITSITSITSCQQNFDIPLVLQLAANGHEYTQVGMQKEERRRREEKNR